MASGSCHAEADSMPSSSDMTGKMSDDAAEWAMMRLGGG
jgi:hypothetical protein